MFGKEALDDLSNLVSKADEHSALFDATPPPGIWGESDDSMPVRSTELASTTESSCTSSAPSIEKRLEEGAKQLLESIDETTEAEAETSTAETSTAETSTAAETSAASSTAESTIASSTCGEETLSTREEEAACKTLSLTPATTTKNSQRRAKRRLAAKARSQKALPSSSDMSKETFSLDGECSDPI
jgi:hypothetical protein